MIGRRTPPARRCRTPPGRSRRSRSPAEPSRSARWSMIRSAGRPTPQTGTVCACLSSFSPSSLTDRSRWIASCGMRMIAPVRTRSAAAVVQHDPAGQAQLAVEPGVEQRAAVHLHPQLLPAAAADVGLRLQHEAGRVGVRADDPVRGDRAGRLRDPPGQQGAVADEKSGLRLGAPLVLSRAARRIRRLRACAHPRRPRAGPTARREEGAEVVEVVCVAAMGPNLIGPDAGPARRPPTICQSAPARSGAWMD